MGTVELNVSKLINSSLGEGHMREKNCGKDNIPIQHSARC